MSDEYVPEVFFKRKFEQIHGESIGNKVIVVDELSPYKVIVKSLNSETRFSVEKEDLRKHYKEIFPDQN